jgi:hypothetical protein
VNPPTRHSFSLLCCHRLRRGNHGRVHCGFRVSAARYPCRSRNSRTSWEVFRLLLRAYRVVPQASIRPFRPRPGHRLTRRIPLPLYLHLSFFGKRFILVVSYVSTENNSLGSILSGLVLPNTYLTRCTRLQALVCLCNRRICRPLSLLLRLLHHRKHLSCSHYRCRASKPLRRTAMSPTVPLWASCFCSS